MKRVIVVGAGAAGTGVANRLARRLPAGWRVSVVDPSPEHLYRADLPLLALGLERPSQLSRPRERTLVPGVRWVASRAVEVDRRRRRVVVANGDRLRYDLLVLAPGLSPAPQRIPGLLSIHWRDSVHDASSPEGARALGRALGRLEVGRLILHTAGAALPEPAAAAELALLVDDHLRAEGRRRDLEIVLATASERLLALGGADERLGELLRERGIELATRFEVAQVDGDRRVLAAADGRRLAYDMLVVAPPHACDPLVVRSALGDADGRLPVDPGTLLLVGDDHAFAAGGATDLAVPRVASSAYFQARLVSENVVRAVRGRSLVGAPGVRVTLFVASATDRAFFVDAPPGRSPRPGRFPLPGLGPLRRLDESWANHRAKLAFRWSYWHAQLPGRPLPVPGHTPGLGRRSAVGRALGFLPGW